MNLGLHVERLSARRPPPPPYSPNPDPPESIDDSCVQNAIVATVLHRPIPIPRLSLQQSRNVPGATTARAAPSSVQTEGAPSPATERLHHKNTTSLTWGLQFPTSTPRPSSIPKNVVAVSDSPRASNVGARIAPGCQPNDTARGKIANDGVSPRPVMKLPRSDSAQLIRKMRALIDPQSLFQQITPPIRRRRRSLIPDPSYRDEVESLSSWLRQKLEAAADDEYVVQVVATAIDDLIRQVGRQMAERGILLADLIDRDRRFRCSIADRHEQQAVYAAQNMYRERIMALVDNQRSELQRYTDERLEIWNECEELRKHVLERNEMLTDLQHQMDENVKQRDDVIHRQEQTTFQLQCALDDLSVRFNESQQQLNTAKASLNAANLAIADLRLDLRFANERFGGELPAHTKLNGATLGSSSEMDSVVHENETQKSDPEASIKGNEVVQRAATRIQSLIRGRQSRRKTSDLGNIANNLTEIAEISKESSENTAEKPLPDRTNQNLAALPIELRRLFQCPPETYQTYFQQNISLQKFHRWLGNITLARFDYDVYSVQTSTPRLSFAEMVYDYYLSQHCQRESVELDLLDLYHNLVSYRPDSARARLFSRYLSDDMSRVTEAALIAHEGLRFYACGPFETAVDNSEGICWIDVPGAVEVLKRLFRDLPEAELSSALQKIQARSKTLSTARQFTGASRAAYKGIERFMDLDDCLETIWDLLRNEDQRLTTSLSDSYRTSFGKDEEGAPTLTDFEVMLRTVDQSAADSQLRLLQIYRNAGKLAIGRRIEIDDLVKASRNSGILPIPVNIEEFPRLTASRINRIRAEGNEDNIPTADVQRPMGIGTYQRPDMSDEQLAMMQRRLAAMREKVIDTANTWKAKLERMQEKYDSLSSKLRTEYETRLADLLTQERDQAEERLHALEDRHRAKLQLCFEKFEEHRGASDAVVDELRSKLRTTQNELRRLATESASEKQQLYDAVDTLSIRLQEEVAKSRNVAEDLSRRTTRFIEDLSQGSTLMARELNEMTRMMEGSRMGEEDCRARLLAQAVRQASEANMLRRGKLMRNESLRGGDLVTPLVPTVPPVAQLEFEGGQRKSQSAGQGATPTISRQASISISKQASISISRQTSLNTSKYEDDFKLG